MFKNKMSLRLRIFISMIFLVFTATLLILGSTYYQYRTESDQYNSYRQERKENQLKDYKKAYVISDSFVLLRTFGLAISPCGGSLEIKNIHTLREHEPISRNYYFRMSCMRNE